MRKLLMFFVALLSLVAATPAANASRFRSGAKKEKVDYGAAAV